jgi:PD-(D/E)XK endonuclease
MLTTDRKGAIAELAIAKAALMCQIDVYRPVQEGGRYDLLFDFGHRIDRVQCKWAPLHEGVVVIRAYSTRRTADGLRRRPYAPGEIDAIAAYCPDLDRCFYLPVDDLGTRVQVFLRVGPSRNNQSCGVNWADDFDLQGLQSVAPGP